MNTRLTELLLHRLFQHWRIKLRVGKKTQNEHFLLSESEIGILINKSFPKHVLLSMEQPITNKIEEYLNNEEFLESLLSEINNYEYINSFEAYALSKKFGLYCENRLWITYIAKKHSVSKIKSPYSHQGNLYKKEDILQAFKVENLRKNH